LSVGLGHFSNIFRETSPSFTAKQSLSEIHYGIAIDLVFIL